MNLDAVIKQPQEGRSLRRGQTSHIQPREVAGRQVLRWPIHRLTREHAASKRTGFSVSHCLRHLAARDCQGLLLARHRAWAWHSELQTPGFVSSSSHALFFTPSHRSLFFFLLSYQDNIYQTPQNHSMVEQSFKKSTK